MNRAVRRLSPGGIPVVLRRHKIVYGKNVRLRLRRRVAIVGGSVNQPRAVAAGPGTDHRTLGGMSHGRPAVNGAHRSRQAVEAAAAIHGSLRAGIRVAAKVRARVKGEAGEDEPLALFPLINHSCAEDEDSAASSPAAGSRIFHTQAFPLHISIMDSDDAPFEGLSRISLRLWA